MNWDRVSGNWKQFSGKVKEQWGKLTDDEIDQINGSREQLEGKIQESAADLAHVNELLEQEIGERADVERELAATKAALAKAQAK